MWCVTWAEAVQVALRYLIVGEGKDRRRRCTGDGWVELLGRRSVSILIGRRFNGHQAGVVVKRRNRIHVFYTGSQGHRFLAG